MNDNDPAATPLSELIDFLDGFFPERAALTSENLKLRNQLEHAGEKVSIFQQKIMMVARFIGPMKAISMLPFAIQVAAMLVQIIVGWPVSDVAPIALVTGALSLVLVHFFEREFGIWRWESRLKFQFVAAT